MSRGEKIRNVGPKSAAWLRQVGIRSLDELREAGVIEAFLKVRRAGFRPSLNLIYAMEGALCDCHWQDVPEERRAELLAEVEAIDAKEAAAVAAALPEVREIPVEDGGEYDHRNDSD